MAVTNPNLSRMRSSRGVGTDVVSPFKRLRAVGPTMESTSFIFSSGVPNSRQRSTTLEANLCWDSCSIFLMTAAIIKLRCF